MARRGSPYSPPSASDFAAMDPFGVLKLIREDAPIGMWEQFTNRNAEADIKRAQAQDVADQNEIEKAMAEAVAKAKEGGQDLTPEDALTLASQKYLEKGKAEQAYKLGTLKDSFDLKKLQKDQRNLDYIRTMSQIDPESALKLASEKFGINATSAADLAGPNIVVEGGVKYKVFPDGSRQAVGTVRVPGPKGDKIKTYYDANGVEHRLPQADGDALVNEQGWTTRKPQDDPFAPLKKMRGGSSVSATQAPAPNERQIDRSLPKGTAVAEKDGVRYLIDANTHKIIKKL